MASAAQRPMGRAVTSRNAREERVHDLGIEVRARAAAQLVEGLGRGPREPVGAVRGHRIEGVHHRDDAGLQRDLVAAETSRGNRTPSMPLVMRAHDAEHHGRLVQEGRQDLLPQGGVLLDVLELVRA